MKNQSTHIRKPVRRHNASAYLLLMLLSFSASVIVTRLFLTLTGFPKIGGGEFHIAHLLWGGLLLFVASMLMLVLSNRWVYIVGALLSGIGVGLFIDEVGKFITSNNDYFFPLAIPIIYAFFLVTVMIYLEVRRPISEEPRAELYRALEMLQELLDRDLDEEEGQELQLRLQGVVQNSTIPDMTRLAQVLLDFISSPTLQLAPEHPNIFIRMLRRLRAWESRWLGPRRLKVVLTVGLILVGLSAFIELITVLLAALEPGSFLEQLTLELARQSEVHSITSLNWFFVRLTLEGVIGLLLLFASVLLILGRNKRGNQLGYIGLLFSLTIVNLLVFYFDQFGNIFLTLVEALLLFGMIQYRRYLTEPPTSTKSS